MTRTKAIRFNAATDEPLLIQSGKEIFSDCKGKWKSDYFHNNNPIILELACGRGEYTVGLSQIYPDKNFVGVDVKAERMMMGIKKWKELTSTQSDLTPTPLLTERGYPTIGKGGYLHTLAKQNRKEMTTSEEYLWFLLRNRQIEGLKFRRQHPIKGYIADFYCAEHKLIIEVDGGYHTKLLQKEYDTMRDELLVKNGYIILRFTNDDINNNIEKVLEKIIKSCGHPSLIGEGKGMRYPNIAFLRTIIHHIDQFFDSGEVDEIWIVHPDPRPKGHDERRRITSLRFLKMYYNILKPNGILRLKTDDDGLFEYSLEKLNEIEFDNGGIFELQDHTRDLSDSSLSIDHHGIETHYGKMFVAEGRTIKYAVWKKK